jgi:hypothetical protein
MTEEKPIDLSVTPIDITPRPEEQPPGRGLRRWPQRRLALTILAVLGAFVLGLVVRQQPPTQTTSPNPVNPVANVEATGAQCSMQDGQTLQVGIEVANQGAATATILSLQASAPIGGLNLREVGFGSCGQLQAAPIGSTAVDGQPLRLIPPGGSDWMYAMYDVPEACPAPYPVRFLIDVGATGLLDVGGFNDLGNVPYSGCT